MKTGNHYSLTELADLAGVTPRTVRYYVAQGLLPAVGQTGPGAKYDDRHLARLRLIRRLQAEHLPLAEIRRRLDGLTDDDIRGLAETDPPASPTDSALDYVRSILAAPAAPPGVLRARAAEAAPAVAARLSLPPADRQVPFSGTPSRPAEVPAEATARDAHATPSAPDRSQWDRITLSPDVELHVRRPLARTQQKQVDRLVTIARELLEEDRP